VYQRVDDGAVEDRCQRQRGRVGRARDLHPAHPQLHRQAEIEVEIRRPYDGHTIFRSELEPTLYDYRTVQFVTHVKPGEKKDLLFEVVTRQGRNHKQNNVTLATAKIEP
jgi:hypothetical protein